MKPSGAMLLAGLLVLPLGLATPVAEDVEPIEITEWAVPWDDTRPRDPYVDGESRVWFVGQRGHYVAYLEPVTGEFERFALEEGAGPHNLIVDAEGYVWYAGNRVANIGRLDPKTGNVEIVPMPDPEARDPHTLVFDSQGDIWFTVQGGNRIGHLDVETREVHLIEVPTPSARPYGIAIDANDRPWVVEFGSNKLATIDPATMMLEEIELPRAGARPRRIGLTSDGAVWYVDYAEGFLGRYDPAAKTFEEWPAPAGAESRPYAMAIDDRDRVWFVETGISPNRFVGFEPSTQEFFSMTDIGSGGGTVRHMVYHQPTQAIWFGADTNTVGRASLP